MKLDRYHNSVDSKVTNIQRTLLGAMGSLGLALILAGGLSNTASAQIVSGWELSQQTYAPWLQADHSTTTSLVNSLNAFTPGSVISSGWTLEKNINIFTSFTVKAETGFALALTSLTSDAFIQAQSDAAKFFYWGYRIDDGSGYGNWTFSGDYTTPSKVGDFQSWDFEDFTATGTVQFGFFAYGATNSARRAAPGTDTGGYEIQLNGSVIPAPIPEPSTAAFGILSMLAVGLYRRSRNVVVTA